MVSGGAGDGAVHETVAMRDLLVAQGVPARAVVRDLHTGTDAARLMSLLMLVFSVSPILAPLAGSGALAAPPLPVKGTNRRAWNRSMSARVAGVMTGEFNAV